MCAYRILEYFIRFSEHFLILHYYKALSRHSKHFLFYVLEVWINLNSKFYGIESIQSLIFITSVIIVLYYTSITALRIWITASNL